MLRAFFVRLNKIGEKEWSQIGIRNRNLRTCFIACLAIALKSTWEKAVCIPSISLTLRDFTPQKSFIHSTHTMTNRWVGATFKMDMTHIKTTIDSGRVCSPHVIKLMRGPVLWETSDVSAARLMLFLLGHHYCDLFRWCWKNNCKWTKSKAYLKTKNNNKIFPAHGYPPLENHSDNSISSCTSFSSQWDQNTMCWNPILSCNLVVKCWLSYYTTPTFPRQKVLGLLPPLQGVWPCTAPQEAEGTAVLSVSLAGAGPVWPTWWVLCVKVTAATPDFLALPPLCWQAWVSATTVLSWRMPRNGLSFLSLLLHPPTRKPTPSASRAWPVPACFSLSLPHQCPLSSLLTPLVHALPRKPQISCWLLICRTLFFTLSLFSCFVLLWFVLVCFGLAWFGLVCKPFETRNLWRSACTV